MNNFPTICDDFERARWAGALVITCLVANVSLLAAACYLLYRYIGGAVKQRYRWNAIYCLWLGTTLQLVSLVAYGMLCLRNLDSMSGNAWSVVNTNKGSGIARGYFL